MCVVHGTIDKWICLSIHYHTEWFLNRANQKERDFGSVLQNLCYNEGTCHTVQWCDSLVCSLSFFGTKWRPVVHEGNGGGFNLVFFGDLLLWINKSTSIQNKVNIISLLKLDTEAATAECFPSRFCFPTWAVTRQVKKKERKKERADMSSPLCLSYHPHPPPLTWVLLKEKTAVSL